MAIDSIKATNYYAAHNTAQDKQKPSTASVVFSDARDIGKALASGKIQVEGVTVELSEDALNRLREARDQFYADRDAETERYVTELNGYAAMQQREACKDATEDMAKAMETARRIARGDIVPFKDEQKLMEFDKDLYQMAKTAAMLHQAEKHKKHKSLYGDEEKREYTDPEELADPMQKFGVEVEVSLGDVPVVENITEGALTSDGSGLK